MELKIALVGNPNCGKTTLFNALTGANQYVGNWPGVTVEKKEGKVKRHEGVTVTDLPGIYSLSPYTPEEVVARNYLIGEHPDAILNIVDGTNLERNLYLTTQLIEIGIPVVIAINMMDIVRKRGDKLDKEALGKALGCRVVEISALKGDGILEAAEVAIEAAKANATAPSYSFSGVVEHALAHIEEAAVHSMPEAKQRWYAVKIFERDEHVMRELGIDGEKRQHIEEDIAKVEKKLDDDAEAIIINERYVYVTNLLSTCYKKKHAGRLSTSDKIDQVVTNRFLALPIFAAIMFLVYFISMKSVGDFSVLIMNDGLFGSFRELAEAGELPAFMGNLWSIPEALDFLLVKADAPAWLSSLVLDGIVGGVGAVLGFVPQMLILFLLLSLLEDCGYMSRVAFIMDKLFRKFGLSGKSFIPMLVASGCGVPGVMASRTIEQECDRRITIMTTCFIPCGAKMPFVGLIAGALFAHTPLGGAWVATLAYLTGVSAVVISGIILKKTKAFASKPAPFVMELPAYHMPVASNVLRTTWERGWDFIKRAGTVIFASSIIIWTLNSLSLEGGFHYITETNGGATILENLGNLMAWLFAPLGFGKWQAAVATVLGLVAKEEVVAVFGGLGMGSSEQALQTVMGGGITGMLAGMSFMLFNLLCAPCFAAMGAIKREMNDGRWTAAAIGYMCLFAYIVSFIVYNLGRFIAALLGAVTMSPLVIVGAVIAFLLVAGMAYLMFRKNKYSEI